MLHFWCICRYQKYKVLSISKSWNTNNYLNLLFGAKPVIAETDVEILPIAFTDISVIYEWKFNTLTQDRTNENIS